jgi:hypothetical protein
MTTNDNPNNYSTEDEYFNWYKGWLKEQKLSPNVIYEYHRIARNFFKFGKECMPPENLKETIVEFLGKIDNPNHYNNTLAALKKLFEFLGMPDTLKDYKSKQIMPEFSRKAPPKEDMITFGKAIKNKKVQLYYYVSIASAMRPEHVLRLTKNLFDTRHRIINTWMKQFSNKNFFFAFYTEELKPLIEQHLSTLGDNDLVFDLGVRYLQKEYCKVSEQTGIKITPKTPRKFMTTYLKRNPDYRMVNDDVNLITSHTPSDVVQKWYQDNDPLDLKNEYDKASINLKLLT